jgi:protein-L-isoaspartate(D-aspartate) O-methyltransferase
MAYLDLDLEVAPNRFLIKPVVLARMLQASDVKATDKVLVVGCPTGYAAAVIAQFAGQVTSAAGMPADGDATNGPYDLIVLAGATEIVPTGLYKQLASGGQLVGVFALTKPARAVLVTHSHEDFGSRPLFDATAPVLPGMEKLPAFVF